MEEPDLPQAVAALERLKAEHRDLLLRIAADAGMEPGTRTALIEHVLDEEDEKIAQIAELAGGGGSPGPSRSGRGGLTVGSLRPDTLPGQPGSRTLGSLRGRD